MADSIWCKGYFLKCITYLYLFIYFFFNNSEKNINPVFKGMDTFSEEATLPNIVCLPCEKGSTSILCFDISFLPLDYTVKIISLPLEYIFKIKSSPLEFSEVT